MNESNYGEYRYCPKCVEIMHRETNHEFGHDLWRIHKNDEGDLFAQATGAGHYMPHRWLDSDDQKICRMCGAIRLDQSLASLGESG